MAPRMTLTTYIHLGLALLSTETGTKHKLTWSGAPSGATARVEISPIAYPLVWTDASGPMSGNSWTNSATSIKGGSFYRLRVD